jgi:phytoene dehydrogenase-like protein
MTPGNNDTDIAVVGGGLAGLAAAAFAARTGARVVLLERSSACGGRAVTQRRDGFSFNVGPHALYGGGEGMAALRELGVVPRGGKPDAAGGFAYHGGARHALPGGFFSLITTGLLSLPGKLEVARLLGSLQHVDTSPLQAVPVDEGLARLARRHEVRELLAGLIRLSTYANIPTLQSAGAAIDQLKLALSSGVIYLDDGWQTLVDGLRAAAVDAGVDLRAGARVARVAPAGSRAVVHLADESSLSARAVVLAVSPSEAGDLLPAAGPAAAAWAKDAVPIRAACLDVALSRLPDARATFALGIDRPLYLSVHSAVARLAPPGGALIHVAKYLDPAAADDPAKDESELTALLDRMQPGWSALVVHRRFLPRITVSNAVVTARAGGLRGRPGPAIPGIDQVLLAGDWVGSAGMLADASLASARGAAALAVRIASSSAAVAAA